jgi:site-specific recombinase XerD
MIVGRNADRIATRRPRRRSIVTIGTTLSDALARREQALLAEGRAADTLRGYAKVVGHFERFWAETHARPPLVSDLTTDNARAFVLWLGRTAWIRPGSPELHTRSAATVKLYVTILKSLVRWLADEGLVSGYTLARLKTPKDATRIVTPFSADDVQRLLAAVAGAMAVRDRAILYVLLMSGVRASELAALRLSDLDFEAGRARVFGKGARERWVLLDDPTGTEAVRAWLAIRPGPTDRVFVTRDGGPITGSSLWHIVGKIADRAGVAGVHPHRFRHTWACQYLALHPDALFHLQALLGHTQLSMVQRYARVQRGRERLPGRTVLESLGVGVS